MHSSRTAARAPVQPLLRYVVFCQCEQECMLLQTKKPATPLQKDGLMSKELAAPANNAKPCMSSGHPPPAEQWLASAGAHPWVTHMGIMFVGDRSPACPTMVIPMYITIG